ncbi:MAG TPA: hypothetical protein VGY99_21230 [Candidatus Binataceae bacterium]|jgi:hypothetical protein|nr:hypothetical protein [Candidatus Binataceae bacterium]
MRVVRLVAILLITIAAGALAVCASALATDREIADLLGLVKSVRLEVLKFDTYGGKLDAERMNHRADLRVCRSVSFSRFVISRSSVRIRRVAPGSKQVTAFLWTNDSGGFSAIISSTPAFDPKP